MSRTTRSGLILAAASICLTLFGLELALRIYHGKVFHFQSLIPQPRTTVGAPSYHPRLGWIPLGDNIDSAGLRSNGGSIPTTGRPILLVGDSFTFGDEVEDGQTWAAHLERTLNKRVLNGGVDAYGVDQAFLRAELLLDSFDPDVVILSFISDDISRTEYSYFRFGGGWKPYFSYTDGSLALRNVPVPQVIPPLRSRRFQTLHDALSYSFLANTVLVRTIPEWWENVFINARVHDAGESVSVELLSRLDRLTRNRKGRFIAVTLATNGRIGNNSRLPNVVKRAREQGVEVLDLSTEMLKRESAEFQGLFRPLGHYSPEMNRWVGERIARFLANGS